MINSLLTMVRLAVDVIYDVSLCVYASGVIFSSMYYYCALQLGNVGRIPNAAFPSNRKLTPIQNSDIIFLFFPCQNFAEKNPHYKLKT